MTNEAILRAIWRDEVVNSKKRRILRLISSVCAIKEGQARQRMYGSVKTNDAEFFAITEILKCNNINLIDYADEIRRKKCPYFGGYEAVDFE